MDRDHPAPELRPATRLIGTGRPAATPGAGLNPAVEFTSTFHADGDIGYGRVSNPTWTPFEELIGELEGGHALAFASGMAAVSATLSLLPDGGTVLLGAHVYNGTSALLEKLAAQGRLLLRRLDLTDLAAVRSALPDAAALWVESPANPTMEVCDLPELFAASREFGVLGVCDNTFATPLLQQPLKDGSDVVIHSATKFIAGHSDVLLGVTVAADEQLNERLHEARTLNGAIPGPMETWLALRGARTLHVRLERASSNAVELAERLAAHPAVTRVRYPGFGAMLAIEVAGGRAAAEFVERSVRIWTAATSLGGVESLIERRRRIPAEPDTVPEELLRLSVGIEDVEDLWADLDRALSDLTHT